MNSTKKSVLLICDANAIWTKRYVEYVLRPINMAITLVSNTNTIYKKYYKENSVNVITVIEGTTYAKIPKLRAAFARRKIISILNKTNADIVNIFFMFTVSVEALSISKYNRKIICTYWGSDLLRNSKQITSFEEDVFKRSEYIVLMSEDMRENFIKKFGKDKNEKIRIIGMGTTAFKVIDKVINKAKECKKFLVGEKNSDKIVITIGYNSNEHQQHTKVIEALTKIPVTYKNSIHLVIPMTYPKANAAYLKSIRTLASLSGMSFTIICDYMEEIKIAELCTATDIFVNAQTTDVLSSSMLEQIYAGSYVINGEWLKYSQLEEMGIKCTRFSKFDELVDLIIKHINADEGSSKLDYREVLNEQRDWLKVEEKWKALY